MTMAGLAAVFWGSMGVAGQYLLQNCHFTPMDLISIRMLLAGSIFVGIEFFLLKRFQLLLKGCTIEARNFVPLAPATIKARQRQGFKGTKALIRTGALLNAIQYVVDKK